MDMPVKEREAESVSSPPAEIPETSRKTRKKRSKKKWVILAVVVIVLALIAAFIMRGCMMVRDSLMPQYTYATAERRDVSSVLTDSAALEPADSYTVISLVSGEILYADFSKGDIISKDDVLYEIDSSDASTAIERAELALSQRQRYYQDTIDAQSDLIITAPISGRLSGLTADTGDTVSAMMPVATIENTDTLILTEYYSNEYAGSIYAGMPATVSVPDSMLTLSGSVKEVSGLTRTSETGIVCFAVTVQLSNPGSLSIGDAATCWLNGASGEIYPSIVSEKGLEASDRTVVYSDIMGKVSKLNVRDGEKVSAGQTIMILTSDTLPDEILNAADSLRDAELSLESQYDMLDNYTIRAPIDGTIVDKYYKEGENAETGRILCTIFDLSSLTLTLAVDELDIKSVAVGQKADITADAVPDVSYEGVITEIGINGTVAGGVTTYPVKIRIDSTDGLLPGMNADVSIVVRESRGAVTVPADAVMTGSRVLVKTADGSTDEGAPNGYKYVTVEIGASDEEYVEIISGISEGDEIAYIPETAVVGYDFLRYSPMGDMSGSGMGGGPQMGGGF